MALNSPKDVSECIGDDGLTTESDELDHSNRNCEQQGDDCIPLYGPTNELINKPTNPQVVFRHKPLPLSSGSIRLVKVLSPSPDGTIRCRTKVSNLDTADYTCLSYVWGSEENLKEIIIDGRPFPVARNLHDFLATTARTKQPGADNQPLNRVTKSLWIDAICIDQSNLTERSHQVQQMGSVYSQARQVISWLGNSSHIARLLRYSRQCCLSGKGSSGFKDYLQDLTCFGENDYWTRAWITQETCLAKRLYFLAESEMLCLEMLQEIQQRSRSECNPDTHNRLWRPLQDIENGHQVCSLLENLWRFRRKQCKEPRDLIYSLLSMSTKKYIVVDYTSSLAMLAKDVLPFDTCLCHAEIAFRALGVSTHNLTKVHATRPLLCLENSVLPMSYGNAPGHPGYVDTPFSEFEKDTPVYQFCLSCAHGTQTSAPSHKHLRCFSSSGNHRGHLFVGRKAGLGHLSKELLLIWKTPDARNLSPYHKLTIGKGTRFYFSNHDDHRASVRMLMSTELVLYILSQVPMDDAWLDSNIKYIAPGEYRTISRIKTVRFPMR